MELGLSLGDASKKLGFLKENNTSNLQHKNSGNFDFSMTLGLNSGNQEREKGQRSQENDEDNDEDEEDDQISVGDGSDDNQGVQLNLLPLAPVPRQISSHLQSLPWSSDNGKSIH